MWIQMHEIMSQQPQTLSFCFLLSSSSSALYFSYIHWILLVYYIMIHGKYIPDKKFISNKLNFCSTRDMTRYDFGSLMSREGESTMISLDCARRMLEFSWNFLYFCVFSGRLTVSSWCSLSCLSYFLKQWIHGRKMNLIPENVSHSLVGIYQQQGIPSSSSWQLNPLICYKNVWTS